MIIKTFAQLESVLHTMEAVLPDYAATLGTTVADQTFLTNSLANLQYLNGYVELYDSNKKSFTSIRQRLFKGPAGAIPDGPVTDAFSPPFPLLGDVHGELMKLIGRIEGSNNYLKDPIGIALGIAGDAPLPPDPSTLKPSVQAFAAQSGYLSSVVLEDRAGYEMWEIEAQVVGSATWTNLGRFSGKSQDIVIELPGTNNQPVQVRIRVRLWKGASHVGLWSDEVTLTLNP